MPVQSHSVSQVTCTVNVHILQCTVVAYIQEYIQPFHLQHFITVLQTALKIFMHIMSGYVWILNSIFSSLNQTHTCGIRHLF